ncbi:hypothetical protein EV361DRAFT_872992 [Lentinula raphanica]|nr:hypothetical protein EV361DRAFT_872992 [Lentinula raphanica]
MYFHSPLLNSLQKTEFAGRVSVFTRTNSLAEVILHHLFLSSFDSTTLFTAASASVSSTSYTPIIMVPLRLCGHWQHLFTAILMLSILLLCAIAAPARQTSSNTVRHTGIRPRLTEFDVYFVKMSTGSWKQFLTQPMRGDRYQLWFKNVDDLGSTSGFRVHLDRTSGKPVQEPIPWNLRSAPQEEHLTRLRFKTEEAQSKFIQGALEAPGGGSPKSIASKSTRYLDNIIRGPVKEYLATDYSWSKLEETWNRLYRDSRREVAQWKTRQRSSTTKQSAGLRSQRKPGLGSG